MGLVQVLKNGKRRVPKKGLAESYPCTKEFLFEFSEEHPDVLADYKASLPGKTWTIGDADIEGVHPRQRKIDLTKLIAELEQIRPGHADAHHYHHFICGVLVALFHPHLRNPEKEAEISEGRKRINIRFTNAANEGFFHALKDAHNMQCPYVFFECKNYAEDPSNEALDQLTAVSATSEAVLAYCSAGRSRTDARCSAGARTPFTTIAVSFLLSTTRILIAS